VAAPIGVVRSTAEPSAAVTADGCPCSRYPVAIRYQLSVLRRYYQPTATTIARRAEILLDRISDGDIRNMHVSAQRKTADVTI
jgi:hypothetical protein